MLKDIPDLIRKRAYLTPNEPAMSDGANGEQRTYAELNAASERAAFMLVALGVRPGDRVAILCRNRIEFFEVLFAAAKVGLIVVPLNWRMPGAEIKGIIDRCGPKVIIAGAEDRGKLSAVTGPVIIDLDTPGKDGYTARCAAASKAPLREFWPGDEVWYFLYTSGTTGAPKAVMQTYQMALVNYINVRQAINLTAGDKTLNYLPLFHTAGINLYTLPFLFAGGEVQIFPGFEPDDIFPLLTTGAIDAFFAVPAVYQEISLHPDFAQSDLSKVRNWGCGGAPLPDILIEKFADRGAIVCNGYGMTETGPTAYLMDKCSAREKIGSVGKIQLMTDARIVAADGAPVVQGETGEIQFKGPGITPGYWNAPEATKDAFTEDGWLRTGDLGLLDTDNFAYVVGRLKEMYISGGENVYPAEVENVYARHPAILEAAVIGVPDIKWGEVGHAFLLMREGEVADAAALTAYGREFLAAYKVPKGFTFVEDFPRTAAGKVQKHLLEAPKH